MTAIFYKPVFFHIWKPTFGLGLQFHFKFYEFRSWCFRQPELFMQNAEIIAKQVYDNLLMYLFDIMYSFCMHN